MSAAARLFEPTEGGAVACRLPEGFREVLAGLCEQLETLLVGEDPSSDPAVARLLPAAYPDDPLRELEFERTAGGDRTAGRVRATREVRASLDAERLEAGQALAWLRTLNDLRLVLGTRLDVTEESGAEDFEGDVAGQRGFDLYLALGEVQSDLLLAIDPGSADPPGSGVGAPPI